METCFTIQLAGVTFAVQALNPGLRTFCQAYLVEGVGAGEGSGADARPAYTVVLEQSDVEAERRAWEEQCERDRCAAGAGGAEGAGRAGCTGGAEGKVAQVSDLLLEELSLCRKVCECLFDRDTVLFHGSALCVDGRAIIFTAKSGVGKSTHARLWRELLGDRVQMLNDDKPFLQVRPGETMVYGSPWDGKHRLSANARAPLAAVCFLSQGPENVIREIGADQACARLVEQTHIPELGAGAAHHDDALLHTLELLDTLSQHVAFYELTCLPNSEAARVAYQAICCDGGAR